MFQGESSKSNWADTEEDSDCEIQNEEELLSDDDPEQGSDLSIEDAQELTTLEFPSTGFDQPISCKCLQPTDSKTALNLMNMMLNEDLDTKTIDCIIDNIIRCLNKILEQEHNNLVSTAKIACIDLFYRLRHEIMYKLFTLAYRLPSSKSDTPFTSFGIDSNRTPDLIYESNGTTYIFEIAVVGNKERGGQSKGVEEWGFEGKYRKEVCMLNELGVSTKYFPVIFNMNDIGTPYSKEHMDAIASVFPRSKTNFTAMISKAKLFCMINRDITDKFVLSSTLLFSKLIDIPNSHASHEFLYERSNKDIVNYDYEELVVSPYVYKKLDEQWNRLYDRVINKDFQDSDKISFKLSLLNHKFTVDKDPKGVPCHTILDFLKDNNKFDFLKNLTLTTNYGVFKATENEKGVRFFIKRPLSGRDKFEPEQQHPAVIGLFLNHTSQQHNNSNFNLNDYKKYVDSEECLFYNYRDFDNNYEELLIDKITEFDYTNGIDSLKSLPLIGFCQSIDINIDKTMEHVIGNYLDHNSPNELIPVKVMKMKQPFILPLAGVNSQCYSGLNNKCTDLCQALLRNLPQNSNFLRRIIESVLNPDFVLFHNSKAPSKTYRDLTAERIRVSNQMNQLQKEFYKTTIGRTKENTRVSRTNDPLFKDRYTHLRSSYNEINKKVQERGKSERIKERQGFIRLPSKGTGQLAIDFKDEMDHFKSKNVQSTIEGVGIREGILNDYKKEMSVFQSINSRLVTYSGKNPDPLIDFNLSEDVKLLTDLKKIALDNYKDLVDQVQNSQLGHSSAFISRLCHTLMYLSQQSFNSDYIKIDNLGYKNVLLIVRGGKKIFRSKSSKLFRLIIPLLHETLPWYQEGRPNKGSVHIFHINGVPYLLTPWIMLHENILTDGISFYPRVCSFVILNLDYRLKLADQYNKVSLNVLLAFHNRRQTEVLLANLRYILLSTLGDFTGVEDILDEFFGFNYDCFQSFVRNCIALNYSNYFKTFQKIKSQKTKGDITLTDFTSSRLKNIFTMQVINDTEELALMIYSTFLMTKAPYQKSVERSTNLKSILKIHEQYDNSIGLELSPECQYDKISVTLQREESYAEYAKRLFSNDFNIDPKFCSLVGCFINSELKNRGLKDDLFNKWYSILGSAWDEMATSTGLRGHYDQVELFWGQKGYFVVYKDLLNDSVFKVNLQKLFMQNTTTDEKRKILKSLNQSYHSKLDGDQEFLIFHAVEKSQWKGSREIYVMDIDTKLIQQPIEKFMGYLCQKLDNELISIPSDKRSQVIHHSIFEKDLPLKDTLTWYLTLDCTKWAPKSVFVKFITTFLPMDILPNSFKKHFMNYSEKLFVKRIYFNTQEVQVLLNNPIYEPICTKYLLKDEKINGYYLLMPYSWVMGIFNYTSSFLHAANQQYISYLIMKTSILSYQEETSMFMFAHSDDSGGRLTAPNKQLAIRALAIYEIGLKSCNHLLSKKKSVISRIYFEILSIIYLFKKLLALLPKFLGGLRFLPTDKGACQDMSQSYSKCIEVLVSGANFSVAYIVLKIYSMMIWRFYYNQDVVDSDYRRPTQYMGMPDAHPLMILLCGSDSDILRIFYNNKDNLLKQMSFCRALLSTMDEAGPIKPLKFEIKVKNIRKGFEEALDLFKDSLDSWSVRNVNYHNSAFNFLNFLNKLRDSGFVGSLVNESTVRRFSRSYFMRSNDSVITNMGNLKLSELLHSMRLFQGYTNSKTAISTVLKDILSEEEINNINKDIQDNLLLVETNLMVINETLQSPLKIYKYLDLLSMEGRKINYQPRTLKPTVVQLVKSTPVFSTKFDPNCLVSYIKEEEYRWAIPDLRGMFTSELELKELLDRRGLDLEKIDPDSLLKICRDFGPNCTKTIYLYSRVPSELRQVKSYSAFLTFLSVNSFEDSEITGLTLRLNAAEMSTEYTQGNINDDTYNMINILNALCVLYSKVDYDFYNKLCLNSIDEIGFEGGTISEYIKFILDYFKNDVHLSYYMPYVKYIDFILNSSDRSAEFLYKCAYYTFIKSQRLKSGWYGKGEIYINIEHKFYSFMLFNSTITSVRTNHVGKVTQHHSDYIIDVLSHNGLEVHNLPKIKAQIRTGELDSFGFDYSGHLASSSSRELVTGVPCLITTHISSFVDELHTFNVTSLVNNTLTLTSDLFGKKQVKKIYALPLKKGEIVNTYMRILRAQDFADKLNEYGLESFEEFIFTELLTEYGQETYVPFDSLIDNFTSSKVYQIFNKCRKESISFIPSQPNFSNFPASEGSLTRILIDYGEATGSPIIKINRDINQALMQVLGEYPQQMSVVLVENLLKSYESMFDKTERKEISDEYHNLSESNDPKLIRDSIIKLMTHWGYGSLVNTVQTFSLKRQPKNYAYFNMRGIEGTLSVHMAELFVVLINEVFKELMDWQEQYNGLDFLNPRLKSSTGLTGVLENYVKYISVSCYQFVLFDRVPDINAVMFNTLLCLMMQEEDFCSSLQHRLSSNYILGSLPISYNHRRDFIVTLNTLRHFWNKNNCIEYQLSTIQKNERLPNNIPNWKSISRVFTVNTPPTWSMYNGYINPKTVGEMMNRGRRHIQTRFGKYIIDSHFKELSKIPVNTCSTFKPVRPIKTSILESDTWEEFQSEFDFDEPDEYTIEDYKEQLGNLYVQKSTKIKGFGKNKEIFANITWLIGTLHSCKNSYIKYVRQTGQNIVLLTTSYTPGIDDYMHNCKTRVIQYTPGEVLYCHISFQNELNNDEFIDKLLGTVRTYIQEQDLAFCYSGLVRDSDGEIKDSTQIGTYFDDDLMSGQFVIKEEDDLLKKTAATSSNPEYAEDEIDSENSQSNTISEEKKSFEILKSIAGLKSEGLDEKICERLKTKYLTLLNDYKLSFKLIMKSLMDESTLHQLTQDLKDQKIQLTPEQYTGTFLAPSHFGASHGLSTHSSKNLKDKNIKAEIESLHSELSERVGSGVLYISDEFKRIVLANLKMWKTMVKNTKYKRENKAFAVLFFTTILSCAKPTASHADDIIWQSCLNKMSLCVTQEIEEDDEDDFMSLIEDFKSLSRLKYMPKGT